jgi:hypothetical protein
MEFESLSLIDYEKLKRFFIFYVDWFVLVEQKNLRLEDRPAVFLENLERASPANAKTGLQMVVNDVIEMAVGWPSEKVTEADLRFAGSGAFTLSEVRCLYSQMYRNILKRGSIRSEAEYYLLEGVVDGGGFEPGQEEMKKIESMTTAFEARLSSFGRK